MDQPDHSLDDALRRNLGGRAPDSVHTQADARVAEFAAQLPAPSPRRRPGQPWLWWAGGGLAGSAVATVALLLLFVAPSPTWAQVTEKFRLLRFFNATVFVTESAGQPPERIDLWVAPDNRLRAHYRDLIFFGADGRIERVLSSTTGRTVALADLQAHVRSRENSAAEQPPGLALVENIARMSESSELSLDRLLALLRGRREQLTPAPLAAPELAEDLQIFDLASDRATEWARLWVLRHQELPLRLRVWNAANAGQIEVLFDYTTRLPDAAFDAGRVAAAVGESSGAANRLYAALTDPGEKPLTPAALLAGRRTPPVPEIDTVGRTPEGVIWVLSRRADNLRPDGESVPGWDDLTDSLGQKYQHQLVGWLPAEEIALEFFVPENLSQGFQTPTRYELLCRARSASGSRDGATLAKVAIEHWLEKTAVPDLSRAARNEVGGRTRWELLALDEAAEQLAWEDFEELAAHIPGEPEQNPVALARDLKRVVCLRALQRDDDAARLCTRLYPLLTPALLRDEPLAAGVVRGHIAQLYRDGKRDQARRLANRHVAEELRRSRLEGPIFIVSLLVELRAAGLTDARGFLDRELIDLPAVRAQTERLQLFRPAPPAGDPARRS